MSYLPPIPTLWVHSVHPSTNVSTRPPSPDHPRGVRLTNSSNNANNANASSSNLSEQQIRNDAIERSNRYNTRASHLPFRGAYHQRNRLVRAFNAQPTVGSTVDADEVSDEEIAMENRKGAIARFGHRSIVAIGRRKTAYEEELSADEDNPRRPGYDSSDSSSDFSSSSEGEGAPGAFVGGHTGHAAAQLQAVREARARVAAAEAERDQVQARLDAMRSGQQERAQREAEEAVLRFRSVQNVDVDEEEEDSEDEDEDEDESESESEE